MSLKRLVVRRKSAWAIFGINNFLLPFSVRSYKQQAIQDFEMGRAKFWEEYLSYGYSCRKVTIVEAPQRARRARNIEERKP